MLAVADLSEIAFNLSRKPPLLAGLNVLYSAADRSYRVYNGSINLPVDATNSRHKGSRLGADRVRPLGAEPKHSANGLSYAIMLLAVSAIVKIETANGDRQ